jgi:hypothetical protein
MKKPGSIILAGLCAVSFSVAALAQAQAPDPGRSPGHSVSHQKPTAHSKKAKRGAKKHGKKRYGRHSSKRAPIERNK